MAETQVLRDVVVGEKFDTDINFTEKNVERPRFYKNSIDEPLKAGDIVEDVLKVNGVVIRTITYTVEKSLVAGKGIQVVHGLDFVEMNIPEVVVEPK